MTFIVLNRLLQDESGVATVELALIAVLIMLAAIPVIDMASGIHSQLKMTTAMRSGIFYAYRKPFDTPGIENALRQASNLTPEQLSVTNTQSCYCSNVEIECTTSCPSGMSTYINLTANYRMALSAYYPGYGSDYVMTQTSSLRIK